ncbi:MAG: hypothetical protein AAF682_00820 [Planctomycetota bacterium]
MDGIQGIGGLSQVARALAGGGANGAIPGGAEGAQRVGNDRGPIRNDSGQTPLDLRDELKSAVREAIADAGGQGDLRSIIHDAIQSALRENGFDPDALRDGLRGGFGGGNDSMQLFGGTLGLDDPQSVLRAPEGSDPDGPVKKFLMALRPGANLDTEG